MTLGDKPLGDVAPVDGHHLGDDATRIFSVLHVEKPDRALDDEISQGGPASTARRLSAVHEPRNSGASIP